MQQWLQLVFQQIPLPQLAHLGYLSKIKFHLICFYFSQLSNSVDFDGWNDFLAEKSKVTDKSIWHQLITHKFSIFTPNVTVACKHFITMQVIWKDNFLAHIMYQYSVQFD